MTSMMTARTLVWDGRRFRAEEVGLDTRGRTLIEVVGAGLCGTDLHVMEQGPEGIPGPLMLGHEIAGRVISLAPDQLVVGDDTLSEGDLVALVPGVACGRCPLCLSFGAHEHLCPHRTVHGFSIYGGTGPAVLGGFSSHVAVGPQVQLARVEDALGARAAVVAEPLAIAVRACERALGQGRPDLGMGSLVAADVLVIGAGPIGAAVAMVAQELSAGVIVIDPNEWRVAYARDSLGLDTRQVAAGEWVAELKADSMRGLGFDVVIDVTGDPSVFPQTLDSARPGGRIVELGSFVAAGAAPVDPSVICRKDLEVVGSVLAPPTAYLKALRLIERDPQRFGRLVTDVLTLNEVAETGQVGSSATSMKRVIVPNAGKEI